MIDKIRELIVRHITLNCNLESWEEIRTLYSAYTYVSFLAMEIKNIVGKIEDIKSVAVDLNLESEENIEHIFKYPGIEKVVEDVSYLIEDEQITDIHALYQNFLAIDFVVIDHKISFSGGKNNRDTLGSYYTQEEFAYEISKKAIEEYLLNCESVPEEICIADFSCGGGAFLIAASKLCEEKKIQVSLLGIDVDPIAIMITKGRLISERVDISKIQVRLGNPLLKEGEKNNTTEAFSMALKGRYNNSSLGISITKKCDVVVGNPPWEKIRFEEKKFLAHYVQSDLINSKKNRNKIVTHTSDANKIFYFAMMSDYEKAKCAIKKNTDFQDTRNGELNTYALFAEFSLNYTSSKGVVGIIVKSSLFKMPAYSGFMKHNMETKKLFELYMFVNKKKIFNIDSREEFSVVFYKNQNNKDLHIAVGLEEYKNFVNRSKIRISIEMLELLNPETGMIPNIMNNDELDFLIRIYSQNNIFGEKYKDCHFGRLVHLTNHSRYIVHQKQESYLSIYEGKFIELYTGKYATFKDMNNDEKYKNKATARIIDNISGNEYPESRFFIDEEIWKNLSKNFDEGFIVAWRSLTSATNRRTMLATILPLVPTCQSIQFLQLEREEDMLKILALFNSIVFDYVVRLKMAGLDLTQTIVRQIPVPCDERYEKKLCFYDVNDTVKNHIISRLKCLYADDIRVKKLFDNNDSYEIMNKTRKQIIAELDCLVGYLYGLTKEEIKDIAKKFNKYYAKEEVEQWF